MGNLFAADATTAAIVLRSLAISGIATALAVLVGVPAGYVIARRQFRGRTILLGLINTGMGMPPVVVGLVPLLEPTRKTAVIEFRSVRGVLLSRRQPLLDLEFGVSQ